jgi:hypothetical protein
MVVLANKRFMGGAAAGPTQAEVETKIINILTCFDKIDPATVRRLFLRVRGRVKSCPYMLR